jgi:hypothetical protein
MGSHEHQHHHHHRHCDFPKEYCRKAHGCVCNRWYRKNHCVGREVFTEARCCHCPFKREPANANPASHRWSWSNCNHVCRNKTPAGGCPIDTKWCKKSCACVSTSTTTILPTESTAGTTSTSTTTITQTTTTQTTTTAESTTTAALCPQKGAAPLGQHWNGTSCSFVCNIPEPNPPSVEPRHKLVQLHGRQQLRGQSIL